MITAIWYMMAVVGRVPERICPVIIMHSTAKE